VIGVKVLEDEGVIVMDLEDELAAAAPARRREKEAIVNCMMYVDRYSGDVKWEGWGWRLSHINLRQEIIISNTHTAYNDPAKGNG
jgi:hypothetical protein